MSPKYVYPKQDRLLYLERVTRRVCEVCDEDRCRCQESGHRTKVVERWRCKICDQEHRSKAGVIRHLMEEHERQRRTFTDRCPPMICEDCGDEFLHQYQYYEHRTTVRH